ncbi:threonine/serine ThrE exporter family protein [Cellulosilyticum sp. I15G10I2]|uniref:threonine/serine ThrE exporter family protein n=1 Tax=Cellulosilyticum sp. I15G10I2 TaxID=1892843 RepID=UPI00085C6D03|nr:threonine/serine exporter family protein [Cellulosilyticum sp. I15G10I2]
MNTTYSHEYLLNFAVKAGELMLKSGAETYRVEDTITRILQAHHYRFVDTFVIPTGIIVTIDDPDFSICTKVCRVKNRSIRLDRIELINQLSRDYVLGSISFDEASHQLTQIENMTTYSPLVVILWLGISSSFFAIMFKGNFLDFLLTFPIGILIGTIHHTLRKKYIVSYFVLFICSLFIGFSVMGCYYILGDRIHIEPIVTGCIFPLLPGVAFTNAVRDAIGDELLSGISRGVEALLIAISLAAGIGISLSIGFKIGGLL